MLDRGHLVLELVEDVHDGLALQRTLLLEVAQVVLHLRVPVLLLVEVLLDHGNLALELVEGVLHLGLHQPELVVALLLQRLELCGALVNHGLDLHVRGAVDDGPDVLLQVLGRRELAHPLHRLGQVGLLRRHVALDGGQVLLHAEALALDPVDAPFGLLGVLLEPADTFLKLHDRVVVGILTLDHVLNLGWEVRVELDAALLVPLLLSRLWIVGAARSSSGCCFLHGGICALAPLTWLRYHVRIGLGDVRSGHH